MNKNYPNFVKKHFEEAKKMLTRKKAKDVLFSEGIYEVEVLDDKEKTSFWPFIQIDDKGKIIEAFCNCSEDECIHLAVAYLSIFSDEVPLHVSFRNSFWNVLFKTISDHIGYDSKELKKSKDGSYKYFGKTKKELFSIKASSESISKLKEILFPKINLHEETSFKFANLSLEEISLWRKNEAPVHVKYILSFWFDLAQWLFLLEKNNKKYRVLFDEKENEIPSSVNISFEEVNIHLYISRVNLPKIIPYLNSVNSNLKEFPYEKESIKNIKYDEEKKCFYIDIQKEDIIEEKTDSNYIIDQYKYVPKKGFYYLTPIPLLSKNVIEKDEISNVLNLYYDIFEKHLEKYKVHSNHYSLKYHLFIDDKKNLHIRGYIFDVDDFKKENSCDFIKWVFIKDKGFYKLEDRSFADIEKIVKKEDVSEFVNHHRIWLHNIEGFQTHVGSFSTYLGYTLTEDELIFESKINFPEGYDHSVDFGEWLYFPGRGFYAKKEKTNFISLRPGLRINVSEISNFISSHIEELEEITSFFTDIDPIEKIGVDIYVNEDELITVEPKVLLKTSFNYNDLRFFKGYIFIKNHGFYQIPLSIRLPEEYEEKKVISKSKESVFITYDLDKIKKYAISIDKRIKKPSYLNLNIKRLQKEQTDNISFYIAGLIYESDIGSISAVDMWEAYNEKKKFLFSEAGLIDLRDFRFKWLSQINRKRIFLKKKYIKFRALEWIRLCLFEKVEEPRGHSKKEIEIRKILNELYSFKTDRLLNLSLLKSNLRNYQITGVNWLWFLYCHGLSGLLCDEMGLGKTHQAMAILASCSYSDVDKSFKYLVVCPTSVIYHWEDLLKIFLPDLKVLTHHGVLRSLKPFEEKFDILLTSYGILRSERKNFQDIKFEIAIFDEMQLAKNQASKTHRSLREINAKMKMGLTGTPIENKLMDLKALYDIILPNYLPQESIFREVFVNPIEKEKDKKAQDLLHRLIKPFILRRKKSDVLQELPEKIEELAFCDLSQEQVDLYNEAIKEAKKPIIEDMKSRHFSYAHVFSLLSKLKQICDHPSLILKDVDNAEKHQSGKWDLFVELLYEVRESDQKLVVFSQYLDMIAIIENFLKKKNIGFASIKGATQNRKEQIQKFKNDPKCEVFIGSILAAGLGIDLSCASVVIHYDRWWNPAKENQATDRVHRIGQNRGVQVFKLVNKNTIEEHIHKLIEKKMGLFEETVKKDDHEQIKILTKEELLSILKEVSL